LTEATSAWDTYALSAFQPPEGALEGDENASVASHDTIEMTPEEDSEVIVNFTDTL
jgi:hypothetical protein